MLFDCVVEVVDLMCSLVYYLFFKLDGCFVVVGVGKVLVCMVEVVEVVWGLCEGLILICYGYLCFL